MSIAEAYTKNKAERAERGDSQEYAELPAGRNNYKITNVKLGEDKKGRGYIRFALESSEAKGSTLVYLEPMSSTERAKEVFASVIASQMEGLGFDPSRYNNDALTLKEFARFAPSLQGSVVDCNVKHSEEYVNVYFYGIVTGGGSQPDAIDHVVAGFDADIL